MNLENICLQTKELAITVGAYIRQQKDTFGTEAVETKSKNSLVTYVDKTAEQKIVEGLSKLVHEAGFIAEEGTSTKKGARYNWVVDPLDGTTNFIHGLSPFAVSIALMDNEEVILGVVYEISLDECFYAWKGSKAYLNDKEIKVSSAETMQEVLVATGFPYYDYKRIHNYLKSLEYLMHETQGIRRLGSAATDLVYVACGRFEAFYEYSLSAWDVAAGAIIVKQAGGKVCDFKGENNYIFGKEIVATNNYVHDKFTAVVKKYMIELQ